MTTTDSNKCCIIIPTYNNSNTLEDVIRGVLSISKNIIIVNDGSTDETSDVLKKFENIEIISYEKNKGKGFALRTGFKKAIEKGFEYAVTIDSDGQHLPEEIPLFIDEIEKEPNSIIIGKRIFNKENQAKKSSFANRFSNFWFRFFTGLKIKDTQSGFRLYPLEALKSMKFYTIKYEFEFEVLVRAAWRNIKILTIPVNVIYPPAGNHISHFRPFRDFVRISILNTIFFWITFLYIKPFRFTKYLNKKSIKEFIRINILASEESNIKIIFAVMLGVFMGIVPIWGYQLLTAIVLAHLLKLNKFIVVVAANISILPMIPVILYLSYITGGFVMGKELMHGNISNITFGFIKDNLIQYIIGSIIFAVVLSLAFGIVLFLLLSVFRKKGKS